MRSFEQRLTISPELHSVWLWKMSNSCTSVVPNTWAWEPRKWDQAEAVLRILGEFLAKTAHHWIRKCWVTFATKLAIPATCDWSALLLLLSIIFLAIPSTCDWSALLLLLSIIFLAIPSTCDRSALFMTCGQRKYWQVIITACGAVG